MGLRALPTMEELYQKGIPTRRSNFGHTDMFFSLLDIQMKLPLQLK